MASLLRPLRFPWAIDPLTRGTIPRLLVSASWVAKVTFKSPETLRSPHCYIHSLCVPALFIAFNPLSLHFLLTPCRALLPPSLRQQRYDFCVSTTLPFVALHDLLNCLGLLTFMRYCVLPLLLPSRFPSPSFWVFSRGWCFLGFTPLPVMATLVKTFFLSSFFSYLFTP